MKILALSLLRLGDLLQQRPLLAALKKTHGGAQLHVLANASLRSAQSVLPEVDAWHFFERGDLQKQIGTAEIPLLAPLREVEGLIDDLNGEDFDLLVNLTHNRLSAHFAQAVQAKAKRGLVADGTRFLPFENNWLRHFNERFGAREGSPFHYVELLAHAFGLTSLSLKTEKTKGKTVLIQPLTSDIKKNWGLASWRQVLNGLRERRPDLRCLVLGAPFEKETLSRHFEVEDLLIADLTEVAELLKSTALVLSGDTSIKHLAASAGCAVLELALGSAAPEKTGAFNGEALILHAAIDCAPCTHSTPCRRLSHLCGESLPANLVLESALRMLNGQMDEVVEIFSGTPKIKVFRSHLLDSSGWVLRDQKSSPEEFICDLFEKSVWGLALHGQHPIPVGTQSRALCRDLLLLGLTPFLPTALEKLRAEQKEFDGLFQHRVQSIAKTSQNCLTDGFNPQQLQAERRELAGLIPVSKRLRCQLRDLSELGQTSFPSPLAFFGAIRRRLEEVGVRHQIRKKLIDQLQEAGGLDGKPSRNILEHGPTAP